MNRRRGIVFAVIGLVVALVVAAVVTTVVLAQGSDDDSDGPDRKVQPSSSPTDEEEVEAPPPLDPLWSQDVGSATMLAAPQRVGDLIILRRSDGYVGVNAATGEEAWRHPWGASQCPGSIAPVPVAVYLSGATCRSMTAVDLANGKQLWRRQIPRQNKGGVNLKIEVGDRAVTVRGSCDQVLRFSRTDGDALGVIAALDRDCDHETDLNGQLVAVWFAPDDDRVPALQLWDSDSGKMLWSRSQERRGGGLQRLVSGDPLLLMTATKGQTAMRRYDARTGQPGPYVGLRLNNAEDFTVFGQTDEILVGSYHGSTVVGYNLDDGTEAWRDEQAPDPFNGRQVAGVDDEGVLIGNQVPTLYDGQTQNGTWLTRLPLTDGRSVGSYGWIPLANQISLTEGLVLAVEGSEIRAYQLDSLDADLEPPVHDPATSPGWEKDDVQALPVSVGCPIPESTVSGMGFHTGTLPPPAECRWSEGYQPRNVDRSLTASIQLATPSGDTSAVEVAQRNVDSLVKTNTRAKLVQVSGLGDEAWVTSLGSPDRYASEVRLVVRLQNVVVTVEGRIEAFVADDSAEVAPFSAVERTVFGAARDLFDFAGLDLSAPTQGADGSVVRAEDLCSLLGPDAASLAPGLKAVRTDPPRNTDPDHRTTGCAWIGGSNQTELVVHAVAVPGSVLSGESADALAARFIDTASRGTRRIQNLGDEAVIDSYSSGSAQLRTATLTARRGNLVVVISYTASDSKQRMDDEAIRLTKKVLNAHRSCAVLLGR